MNNQTAQRNAVVIGASIGGLLAARSLADYYQQVTVIERDVFPSLGDNRPSVPQGQHAHGLLFKGQQAIEQFFSWYYPRTTKPRGNSIISTRSTFFYEWWIFARYP